MKITIRKQTDLVATRWSGGTTTELAIFPVAADYKKRDFIWRVSTATVELEKSDFTKLAGFRRIIMPLQGDLSLYHHWETTTKAVYLKPYQQHTFDGDWETTSQGKVTDFNLMFSEKADGNIYVLDVDNQTVVEIDPRREKRRHFIGLYTWKGAQSVHIAGRNVEKMVNMQEKEFLLVQAAMKERVVLTIDPVNRKGDVVVVEVLTNDLEPSG